MPLEELIGQEALETTNPVVTPADVLPTVEQTTYSLDVLIETTPEPEYVKLEMSPAFLQRLTEMTANNELAVFLWKLHNGQYKFKSQPDSINYLGISEEENSKISYLTAGRLLCIDDESALYDSNFRYHSRAAKVINKFLTNLIVYPEDFEIRNALQSTHYLNPQEFTLRSLFTERDIDQFNNAYRLEAFKLDETFNVQMVQGHFIPLFYNQDKYFEISGQLGSSCMRYDRCQTYFSIYSHNLNICSLAVSLVGERVTARALVWTIDGKQYFDRIYAISDDIADRMKAYFLVKGIETCYGLRKHLTIKQDTSLKDLSKYVKLNFDEYPYMDTFKYLSPDMTELSNECTNMTEHYLELSSTSGGYEEFEPSDTCDECGRSIRDNGSIIEDTRDSMHGSHLCDNCCSYSEVEDTYISNRSSVYSESCETVIFRSTAIRDYNGDYIRGDDAVELFTGYYADKENTSIFYTHDGLAFTEDHHDLFTEYNNEWYNNSEIVETNEGLRVPMHLTVEVNNVIWLVSDYNNQLNLI